MDRDEYMKIIREVEVDDSKSCLDRFVEGVVFLKSLGGNHG